MDNLKGLTKIAKIEITSVSEMVPTTIGQIRSLKNVRAVEPVNSHTAVVTYEGPVESRAELLLSVQAMGIKVTGFSPVGLPLEMMYMDLVKESR
jgi:hypothetical protein